MRVLTARWLAGGVAAASVALIAGSLALTFADRQLVSARLAGWDDVFTQVTNLALPVVGFVLAFRRPANRIGWLFLAAGLALGLRTFSHHYGLHALVAAPGSWPGGRAAMWVSNWIWAIPLFMLAFAFLLFPTGRPRTPRWRSAAWFVGGASTLATVDAVVGATRVWSHPFITSFHQLGALALVALTYVLLFAALLVGVASLVVRFARSVGEERLQLKWFAAAAVLVLVTLVVTFPLNSGLANALSNLAFLCLWVAIAIAVLKYRLYDIDLVISKAVLYGSLAVFITAVYAEDPAQAGQVFGELKVDAAGALENLRDLARGIYPPLLADLGLAAALNAQAGKSAVPVTVDADGIGRFGQDTEAAVYFCCLEALQNTAKYASASQARICLQAQGGTLRFTVSDDGTGYDARHTPMGSGLRNMADRLAALGGRLEVRAAPGQGTIITGCLPVPAASGNHQRREAALGQLCSGHSGNDLIMTACTPRPRGGAQRGEAVEARREHWGGTGGGARPGRPHRRRRQPADPHQGSDHQGDRARRLCCVWRRLLRPGEHPQHRQCRRRRS